MTTKNSSPYYKTPVRDFYLDLWKPRSILPSDEDVLVTITPKHNQRPDLLAAEIYGSPRLWWVFAMRNPDLLVDPVHDFVAGLEIFTPSQSNIEDIR